jgi:hypothetical protein
MHNSDNMPQYDAHSCATTDATTLTLLYYTAQALLLLQLLLQHELPTASSINHGSSLVHKQPCPCAHANSAAAWRLQHHAAVHSASLCSAIVRPLKAQ